MDLRPRHSSAARRRDVDGAGRHQNRIRSGAGEVRCEITGAAGEKLAVATSLVEPKLGASTGASTRGTLLSVEGTDLGTRRGPDDTLWLVPRWGRPHAADHDCHGASWSDTQIRACIPNIPSGQYQLRVESGGRLAVGGSLSIGAH
jgi:hypothetical protein